MHMDENVIFCAGSTRAARFASGFLQQAGLPVIDYPSVSAKYLLLDVPSFAPNGQLRGGGFAERLLEQLSKDVIICGGNLNHPSLAGYQTVDFLQDPAYLAENAYITAECALDVALPYINITLRRCPALIIGWGRIGKCLGQLLRAIGADVTIAARKEADRAMIHALGYRTEDTAKLSDSLSRCRLIFNTAPEPVLSREQMQLCNENCVKIELASKNGMDGEDVIIARGLPGLHMPESSGKLIADTFLRLCYGR